MLNERWVFNKGSHRIMAGKKIPAFIERTHGKCGKEKKFVT